jgi:hypothetical protein
VWTNGSSEEERSTGYVGLEKSQAIGGGREKSRHVWATGSSETEVSGMAAQAGERRLKPPDFIAKTIFAKARRTARDRKVTAPPAITSAPTIKALGGALCPLSTDSTR